MNASDLLGRPVTDQHDNPVGSVIDIRLTQDGPIQGASHSLRIIGLIVGHNGAGHRLGYSRGELTAPWALAALARRSPVWFVPWEALTNPNDPDGPLHLDRPATDLTAPDTLRSGRS